MGREKKIAGNEIAPVNISHVYRGFVRHSPSLVSFSIILYSGPISSYTILVSRDGNHRSFLF